MAKRTKLTNNSDETDIAALISGDSVFSIPYFQRAYKWKPERLHQLEKDILTLVDDPDDFHFLGAVIIHGRRSNPSDPDVYDVIDGQQRITTIFVYLCAIVRVLAESDLIPEAAALFLKYLVINRETSLASNLKLHSSKDDRAQLNGVVKDLLSVEPFKQAIGSLKIKLLPATGADKGTLRTNYRSALRFLREQKDLDGIDRVRAIYKALLESMSVVQIDVWDPTNGPKIFDSLNSRQEPMTTGDLVRNEVFSRVANEHPDTIERLDQDHWQPFYHRFSDQDPGLFDRYFFPYGLTRNPNLRKSEVYATLRARWSGYDPERIIADLAGYQDAFLDIATGSNLLGLTPDVHHALKSIWRLGAPGSTYPFLMQLGNASRDHNIATQETLGILAVLESFLVRRALCGHEPTGLHSVFKRLWNDCLPSPSKVAVTAKIRDHRTVVWPSKEDTEKAIRARPLYGAAITPYLLWEYDKSLGGDQPNDIPWIEHVLPDAQGVGWEKDFTREQHAGLKDLAGNLIPLSAKMNITLSNGPYGKKRERYRHDSMFKSARVVAESFDEWTPDTIAERGEQLATWATKRWPY